VLNLFIKPGTVYPLYGFHYWAQRAITRLTNVVPLNLLFGDSSYIVYYLRWLGYDLCRVLQTGTNFGSAFKHDNPYLVKVGRGTMIADDLYAINVDYSNTSFCVSQLTIGPNNYLGNEVAYPSQSRTGENCLLATRVNVPVEGELREGVGLLGSPSFEIPRTVERDSRFDYMKTGDELRRRLAAKNRHNTVSIGLLLLATWGLLWFDTAFFWVMASTYSTLGASAIAVGLVGSIFFNVVYNGMVDWASRKFRPLRPLYCSIYEPDMWSHERFWKLSREPRLWAGAAFSGLLLRLHGARVGKRVFNDGCVILDKPLITIGDDCTLNAGSAIQPHSQEDGTFKSDHVRIGAGCTLGVGARVHYGATMGDGAVLATDSFLMKGEDVPPHTRWGENPARELRDRPPAPPALQAGTTSPVRFGASAREGDMALGGSTAP
jgi:non-ribosomal peptide synthetase-like protein